MQAGAIAAAIKPRLVAGGFVGSACVLSLDDRLLRVRSVRLPRMPDDELNRAVAIDGPGRLGFNESEGAEIGWVRAGEVKQGDDFRDEVILVGVQRDPVERLVMALAEAGLRPIAVEPGFIAAARSFMRLLRRAEDQNVVKVLVDVGWRSAGVTIIRGQSIAFHKPLEIGGEAMTRTAEQRLGLDFQVALDLRKQRKRGSTIDSRVDRALFEAVRPIMAEIANEVSLCLRYFGVSFRGSRAESCLLIGGEATEPHFTEILAGATHLPSSVGRPLAGIECDGASFPAGPEADAAWSVAVGLSLHGMKKGGRLMVDRRRLTNATSNTPASSMPHTEPRRAAA